MARIDNAISLKLYDILGEIEKLPASEQATKCVMLLADLLEELEPLNQLKKIL